MERHGLLFCGGRIFIPSHTPLVSSLLAEFHDSKLGGHASSLKTFKRLSALFFWEGMRKDVEEYVKKCHICQQIKYLTTSLAGLLQPLHIPQKVFEEVSMDFIIGLPISQGYVVI